MSDNPQSTPAGVSPPLMAARRFLNLVRYADVYRHAEHHGDGNKKGSPSDVEVLETMAELRQVLWFIDYGPQAIDHLVALSADANYRKACAYLPELESAVASAAAVKRHLT